jgi:hypothetical protein
MAFIDGAHAIAARVASCERAAVAQPGEAQRGATAQERSRGGRAREAEGLADAGIRQASLATVDEPKSVRALTRQRNSRPRSVALIS